ncbi:putative membrane protein YdjX (TVP38/TMEM64 family) [Kineococcus xinjiangensis]|uniref:TVP38/TMEM64 family membrane protein n=1 Tax=Kineococcus xinjiangensis TaxID=512762 RepID=A0A2S6IV48_9ACTN|nr:TVP38/TMEM64 family protein [Kineococcus xinjiangensis]PPK98150.1 putative membrane protein YdjX (TVP38/TMEM64 family) [Kineococcus xinjiangensis]
MPGAEAPDAQRPGRQAVLLRAGVLALLLVAAAVVALTVEVPDAATLRARIAAAGLWAPALFVLLYAAMTLAPLPKNVMSAVAGLLFGLATGAALVWAAAVLGALVAFALGRSLGREAVERFTGARVARVDALLTRRGLLSVVAVRLVPVIPFTAINYAAGLSAVRRRDYVLGTAVGIVPGTVAYVALGAYSTSVLSWPFLTAAAVLVLLSAAGAVVAHRSRRRRGNRDGDGGGG